MEELVKKIFDIKKSRFFIDYNKYHNGNIFGITKTSRLEHMHSNFIAWLLDSNSNHGLGAYPISQFIKTCSYVKDRPENKSSRLDNKIIDECLNKGYIIGTEKIEREVTFKIPGKSKDNKRSIDLLILVKLIDGILPIIIENKVNSDESHIQTVDYFNWAENKFKDRSLYKEPLYVFLTPEYNKTVPTECRYISVKYQDLVDNVLEPVSWKSNDSIAVSNINMYLQCLSFQFDNEKGGNTMAISSEEKKILNDFVKENKNLLCIVINGLEGVSEKSKKALTESVKDYGSYSFEGQDYNKGQLVLAVVKKYVEDHTPKYYSELLTAFPDSLQGSKGVVKVNDGKMISRKDLGLDGGKKRYRVSDPIVLMSGEEILVCTEWGVGNIDKFIKQADLLGYSITRN